MQLMEVYMDYKFFIQEMIFLPTIIILIMSLTTYFRYSLSETKINRLKTQLKGFKGYFIGSFLGAITPFCSCSSVPVFMGLSQMGISKGSAFSFLITSPLVHEVALVMFWQLFGWKIALFYLSFSMFLGLIGGMLVDVFKLDRFMKFHLGSQMPSQYIQDKKLRLKSAFTDSFKYLKKIIPIITIGILIGSFMHNRELSSIEAILSNSNSSWYVGIAVLLGIPLYSGIAVGIPIAYSLINAGLGLGTGLAFILSVAGLSLPEMVMLKSVMKTKLLTYFILYIGIGIFLAGTSLNYFQTVLL